LLHDKELDVCITALYSLKDLYELTGRKQVDAYFDPMLNPDSGKQLLIGCAILLRNYSTYGAQARLEVHVRAYELAPQLRKLSTQFPKSPVPEKYEEHLTWLLAYPEGLNRVTHGNKVFDISVSNPISGENIEISTITSFGLSDISQEKAYDMEFCIEIAGKVSKDTIGEIGAAYGRLYDLVTGEKEVSTGKIYRSITLPAFANMNAVMITDRNSMEWLYRERKQGRVLMVIPLFENEADELEKLAFDQRYNLLRQLQIPINDPERKSAEASLRISKIALDE
jgi:hypothetical protein